MVTLWDELEREGAEIVDDIEGKRSGNLLCRAVLPVDNNGGGNKVAEGSVKGTKKRKAVAQAAPKVGLKCRTAICRTLQAVC